MSRRKRVFTKPDRRDSRYDSALVGHLISKVMRDGKRSLAERIVYAAIEKANEGVDTVDPLEVVTRAIENAKPRVEVKSRREGIEALDKVAEALIAKAEEGDIAALKELGDRIDGKAAQQTIITGSEDGPVRMTFGWSSST